jgi:RNA polymerase sigma factor (sigma-70 family)
MFEPKTVADALVTKQGNGFQLIPNEILGEVYIRVVAALKRKVHSGKIESSPQAFGRGVVRWERSRAYGRDRHHSAKHTPTAEDAVRELGTRLGIRDRSTPHEPLDEMIRQENCRRVGMFLEQLSETERELVLTKVLDETDHPTLAELAAKQSVSERTLQRDRAGLLLRLQRQLED